MNLLPYENLVFESPLPKKEIREKLIQIVEENRSFRFGKKSTSKPYRGDLFDNTFSFERIITYGNIFLPVISGEVVDIPSGTIVSVKMRVDILSLVFMSIWFGICFFLCVFMAYTMLYIGYNRGTFAPFVFFFIGLVWLIGSFKYESSIAIDDLKKVLDAEIVS